jgi:hypothetical protein
MCFVQGCGELFFDQNITYCFWMSECRFSHLTGFVVLEFIQLLLNGAHSLMELSPSYNSSFS